LILAIAILLRFPVSFSLRASQAKTRASTRVYPC
jgi:hypothetical protein